MRFLHQRTGGVERSCRALFHHDKDSLASVVEVLVQGEKDTRQEVSVGPCSHGCAAEFLSCPYLVLAQACVTDRVPEHSESAPSVYVALSVQFRVEAGKHLAPPSVAMWPIGVP